MLWFLEGTSLSVERPVLHPPKTWHAPLRFLWSNFGPFLYLQGTGFWGLIFRLWSYFEFEDFWLRRQNFSAICWVCEVLGRIRKCLCWAFSWPISALVSRDSNFFALYWEFKVSLREFRRLKELVFARFWSLLRFVGLSTVVPRRCHLWSCWIWQSITWAEKSWASPRAVFAPPWTFWRAFLNP